MAFANVAAYLEAKLQKPLVVRDAPIVSPGPGEILVKNAAVAVNPVDWKMQETGIWAADYPLILGEDVAGEVVEVGAGVVGFHKGQRVMGYSQSVIAHQNEHGGYQHYTILDTRLTCSIPDTLSYVDASVLPLAISTASGGLYLPDQLGLPLPSLSPKLTNTTVLVWGGSSSVGTATIQLAKASGLEVFTTASKRNHDLVKKLGADQVFDYNSGTVVDDIIDALKGKSLAGAYDAISADGTVEKCAEIVLKSKATKKFVTATLPLDNVRTPEGVTAAFFGAFTIKDSSVGKAVWQDYIPQALAKGVFASAPDAQVIGHGLEYVQAGMEANRRGLSAKKAVITL